MEHNDASPFSRRDVLSFIGSVVAVGFVGCGSQSPTSPSSASSSSTSSTGSTGSSATSVPTGSTNALCTVTPALTEGPYFVDERLNRSDIRSDPSTGATKAGVPLAITMQLSQVSSIVGCTPLVGALVVFDEALTDVVHAQAPYTSKGRRDTLNTRDGIYTSGGTQLLLPLNANGGAYDGTMYVGVRV